MRVLPNVVRTKDLNERWAGLTDEANCTWCKPGKYQTGVGLVAEANCTWCVAGKYQTGSGVHMPVWGPLLPETKFVDCIVTCRGHWQS
jgi:hypothetical protein